MNIEALRLAIREGICPDCGGSVARTRTVTAEWTRARYDCTDLECGWSCGA